MYGSTTLVLLDKKLANLNFLASQIIMDTCKIFDDPFGPQTLNAVFPGTGGENGLLLINDIDKDKSESLDGTLIVENLTKSKRRLNKHNKPLKLNKQEKIEAGALLNLSFLYFAAIILLSCLWQVTW